MNIVENERNLIQCVMDDLDIDMVALSELDESQGLNDAMGYISKAIVALEAAYESYQNDG